MKITAVKTYAVKIGMIPLEDGGIAPYKGSLMSVEGISHTRKVLIKVETDEDIAGWGEYHAVFAPKTMQMLIETEIAPQIKGMNPFELESIARKCSFVEGSHLMSSRLFASGVNVACWDIIGKALNKPIFELLGGKVRNSVPIAYCLGIVDHDTTVKKAAKIVEDGYKHLKLKGSVDINFDVERLRKIRREVGDELSLRIDHNQALNPVQALEFCKRTEDIYLEYVEEPIRVSSFDVLANLRKRTTTPIAINEDCYVPHNVFQAIKQDAIDAAVWDLAIGGGLTGLKRIGALAEEANLPLAHHCSFDLGITTAAIIHGVCSTPSFNLAVDSAYYGQKDDVLEKPLEIREGAFVIPEGSGLGIEIDEEKIRKYADDKPEITEL